VPDVEHPSFRYTFGVQHATVSPEFEHLRKQLGEAFDHAVIRWAVAQVEELARLGRISRVEPHMVRSTEMLKLTKSDLELLRSMASLKTCEYQKQVGRELFCSAASASDKTAVGTAGLRKLARTSRPICRDCNLPDTDSICSRLTHPRVVGVEGMGIMGVDQRHLVGAYCEIGRQEIKNDPTACRAGGHSCWARVLGPPSELTPAVPYSPRELPVALDFLDAVWKQAFGRPLLRLRSVEKTAALSLPCSTADEFKSRTGDLNELFKLMEVADELLEKPVGKQQTLIRIRTCLEAKIKDATNLENVYAAIEVLKDINTVRNKITHGGAELIEALKRLGVGYPIADHGNAWDIVRSKAADALSLIRSALQTAIEA
jgi:hypothetical protein